MGLLDDLQQLIDRERTREQADEQEARLEARFDRLEQTLGERLTDALSSVLKPKGGGDDEPSPAPSPPPDGPQPAPEPEPEPEPELPVERVTRASVPRIWQGDDEPTTVRYLDAETGEEKSRKGRRKGKPAVYEVTEIGPDETADEPDEPAAESA